MRLLHRLACSNADLQFIIHRFVIKIAVLIFVQHINNVRVVSSDDVIIDDDLVFIDNDRVVQLVVAVLQDVENVCWDLIDVIDAVFCLQLGVTARQGLAVVFLWCIERDESILRVAVRDGAGGAGRA